MMADLYNHDLYSRDIAEKAIEKYNQHIKRCNRPIQVAPASLHADIGFVHRHDLFVGLRCLRSRCSSSEP